MSALDNTPGGIARLKIMALTSAMHRIKSVIATFELMDDADFSASLNADLKRVLDGTISAEMKLRAQEEAARVSWKTLKPGDKVRGRHGGQVGIVTAVGPGVVQVKFEDDDRSDLAPIGLHPNLHLVAEDGRDFLEDLLGGIE